MSEVRRRRLKGRDLVVAAVEPEGVFACTRGVLRALAPDTGAIRWTNKLPGLGYGPTTVPVAPGCPVDFALGPPVKPNA